MGVDQCQFRAAMSRLPTGVTVLTTPAGANGHEVMTANAVTSVSLDPMLLLVSVQTQSRWLTAVQASGTFAVNVLAAHHEHLARWCASRARHDQPELLAAEQSVRVGASGSLLIDDATVAVECRVHAQFPAGDHVLVIGEVSAIHVQDTAAAPLVFFNRAYGTVRDDAAHGRLHSVEPPLATADVYPAGPEVPAAAASG